MSDPVVVALPVVCVLALVHPLGAFAALSALLGGFWLSSGRRPASS